MAREALLLLDEALAAAAALAAAEKLGLLNRLEAGPAAADEVAAVCAIGRRGAGVLLTALAAIGVARARKDGRYEAGLPLPVLRRIIELWRSLPESLQKDRPVIALDTPEAAQALYPDVAPLLGELLAENAEAAAERLAGPGLRVLDVGAGSAPWTIPLARRDPGCRVTAIDLPAVIEAARCAAAAAGCASQFEYRGGNIFTMPLPQGTYDLAIAGNLCHLFDESSNERLLKRLFGTLRPVAS